MPFVVCTMKNIKLRLLSNVIIVYLLFAFAWWTLLLYTKNKDAFTAKANYAQLVMAAAKQIDSREAFEQTSAFLDLQQQYQRQERMIFGEALFFIISLVIGIYLINRGYHKEMVASQERRNFLLSITHELKSPISSIRLVLDTFVKRNLEKPQINQLSNTALEETERLTNLVEDLLLAAKMESAYQPFLESVDLVQLINNIVDRLSGKFPTIDFSFNCSSDTTIVMADKTGLSSIIINLLENAVKYSPNESKINVHLKEEDDQVLLNVADQGFGIPDKEKKKIFRKFYRIGNEDTRSTKGTGLGLYIVKEIVEAHQGRITVKNNQPRGTLFSITLPINPKI